MNLDEALQTFIIEARELLQQMEEALLCIEQAPDDPDTINAIFRAAHTIKGSAGLFGLDHVVSFTHVAESVLDKVRGGEVRFDSDLVALFLAVGDFLGELVDGIAENKEADDATRAQGDNLVTRLKTYLGASQAGASAPSAGVPVMHEPSIEKEGGGAVGTDNWHLSLRFNPEVTKNGMDPISFIRYLCTLGTLAHVVMTLDGIPPLESFDPECCYIGFEISFKSDADKATIESVFDFVREDSHIRILPPHSKADEYLSLIRDLPGEEMRLGEILVKCGTLTPAELEKTLQHQAGSIQHPPRPIGEVLVEQKMVQPCVVEAALEKQKQVKDHKNAESSLIRVDAEKLDQLINLIGELTIAGAGANLVAQRAGISELNEATSTMLRLVEAVRDSALTLRMVQIGATFNRFQ